MIRTLRDMRTIKDLLETAERESLVEGDPHPGAEHVVLAALRSSDDSARAALAELGATPDDMRRAIAQHHSDALASIGIEGDPEVREPIDGAPLGTGLMRSKGSTRELLRRTQEATKRYRVGGLRTGHVLIAACEFEHGTFVAALVVLGIDRRRLAEQAIVMLDRNTSD